MTYENFSINEELHTEIEATNGRTYLVLCEYEWTIQAWHDAGHGYGMPEDWEPEDSGYDVIARTISNLQIGDVETEAPMPPQLIIAMQDRIIKAINETATAIEDNRIVEEILNR